MAAIPRCSGAALAAVRSANFSSQMSYRISARQTDSATASPVAASSRAARTRIRVEKPGLQALPLGLAEQILQADADEQLPALDGHADAAHGQRLVGARDPRHRGHQQQGDGGGAHQNDARLRALAIEIVNTPTYVSRRSPRSPVRSMGSAAAPVPGPVKSPSLAIPSTPSATNASPP